MFATILGALPRPPTAADAVPSADNAPPSTDDEAVRAALAVQVGAGIEPATDGRLRWRGFLGPLMGLDGLVQAAADARVAELPRHAQSLVVAEWQFAARTSRSAVKQALPGPYSAARRIDPGPFGREQITLALAEALNAEIAALAAAGCPLIEIDEPDATEIGSDDHERRLFIDAHRRLTAGLAGTHLSLALTGGNADRSGVDTFIDAPYASYAVDLIRGPDNWRLVTAIPGERGIVCGALDSRPGSDDAIELLVWATQYAASVGGRGLERVGIAVVPGLDRQHWSIVEGKLARLSQAAGVAGLSGDTLSASLDPRAIDSRSAALGRFEPSARRKGRAPG
jgi:methionine synthase II (cobalamin-independent)